MTAKPSEAVVGAWLRLMKAQQAASALVEKAFKAADMPPLAWYDALWELDQAGEGGLRPFDLERRMMLAQYNVSRLVDRLEAAGYAARRPCLDDGRGHVVAITAEGRDLRRRMWPVYAAAIGEAVGAKVTETEADTLRRLLDKLLA